MISSLKEQFLGFYETLLFFDELYGLKQFEFKAIYDWIVFKEQNEEFDSYEKAILEIEFFHKHNKSPLLWVENNKKTHQLLVTFWQ